MLLAVDVGNTNLTIGLFAEGRLIRQWRVETDLRRSAEWYAGRLKCSPRPEAVIYGSVVSPLDAKLETAVRKAFGLKAIAVTPRSRLGLKLKVRTPGQVGADRILNALALKVLFGGPAIAIDFGTATTFDCVDAKGDYIGGAILLGPDCAARALHQFTAKLPLVKVRKPATVVGKDTVHCLEAGLYYGYLGMIKEVLARTKAHMGGCPVVVATGGLAPLFLSDLHGVRREPDLTLHGLRFAHEISHHA
ncbi:MAG: type III pantothenate kinase [Elusimicrobiota bacterium]